MFAMTGQSSVHMGSDGAVGVICEVHRLKIVIRK